jgi:hypothetical protein
VRVGVRTTLLRRSTAAVDAEALTLMGLALVTALVVAFLLGNLALRPMEELSMQLDYWTPTPKSIPRKSGDGHRVRVSSKIERIGQRMRNVEEVFSALKENLDQVLGNLQDGIMLFTGDGRAVLVSTPSAISACGPEPAAGPACAGYLRPEYGAGQDRCARPGMPA